MASSCASPAFLFLPLMLLLYVSVASGGITCESLDRSTCTYAVSSSGMRYVLKKHVRRGGQEEYTYRTSRIEAGGSSDLIETNQCVEACGVDRNSLGIPSDSLLDSHFTQRLCSDKCYKGCPNIVDLYFNLAAGEGQQTSARRNMAEIRSSGEVVLASGPESASSGKLLALAPTKSLELLTFGPAPQ